MTTLKLNKKPIHQNMTDGLTSPEYKLKKIDETVEWLKSFPVFKDKKYPFKIGIEDGLNKLRKEIKPFIQSNGKGRGKKNPEYFSRRVLRKAIGRYVETEEYQKAIIESSVRYKLDGIQVQRKVADDGEWV